MLLRIQTAPLSLDALIAATRHPAGGALIVFAGTVRNHHEGRGVVALEYTAHVALAEKLIRQVEQETRDRFPIQECRVAHRIGRLSIGDAAIYAAVRASHRREAFAASRYLVDAVKHRVPIWKEEFYTDGTSRFVEGCCLAEDPASDETQERRTNLNPVRGEHVEP